MLKKRILPLLLVGAIALLASGCGGKAANPAAKQEEAKVAVEVAKASRGDIAAPVTLSGTVAAKAEVQLAAQVPGKVAEVLADIGSPVTAGQVLVRLDARDIAARLQQAEALAAQARVSVKQAQVNYDDAKRNFERAKQLKDAGAISDQQFEQSRSAWEAAQVGLRVAQAQIESTAAAVEQARVGLDNTAIKAPFSGVVAARLVEPGAMAQGPLLTIVDLSSVTVTIGVTERDINFLRQGQEVSVEIPTALKDKFAGRITNLSPAADARKTFTVKVEVANPQGVIKPGMTARISFRGAEAKAAVLVPKQAVVNRGGQNLVFYLKDGRAAAKVVEVGLADNERVEIRAGVSEGEEVVVKGQEFLEEGRRAEAKAGGQK